MPEEVKEEVKTPEEPKEEKTKATVRTIFKVILGLVLIVLGVWVVLIWRIPLWIIIRGCLGPFLILAGIITLGMAKE